MLTTTSTSSSISTQPLHLAQQADLGQFFTPREVAQFMASLFRPNGAKTLNILDPGAGIGTLSVALLEHLARTAHAKLAVTAYELDPQLTSLLDYNLRHCCESGGKRQIFPRIISGDFVQQGVADVLGSSQPTADYAILNPPYRKINSNSDHRLLLRQVGIETVNLYSAFVALSLLLLKDGGELVAIIPRSFCNGPYFKSFRQFVLERAAIRQIHIFSDRNKAFKADSVLQENVIVHLQKGRPQTAVKVSSSSGDGFGDYAEFVVDFDRIVASTDPEKFIHIPANSDDLYTAAFERFSHTLAELEVEVSTGPVVDFRVRDFLRREPEKGTAPLIYPAHFAGQYLCWPKANFKKPNALLVAPETQKQLFPAGCYTLVRRFSSKEEKRRIVARVLTPNEVPAPYVGFENHLNVFHHAKKGLPKLLALGLAVYLNSTLIDEYFRQFNGHTQVNATDLRLLKYPSLHVLLELGKWAEELQSFEQAAIDAKISSFL